MTAPFRGSVGAGAHPVAPATQDVSVCELLDRVLNKGVVLTGEITVSVADIDLLYVGLSLLVSSVETLLEGIEETNTGEGDRL